MTENTDEIILVNDLDSLREAAKALDTLERHDGLEPWDAIDTIQALVPRLIKSYEDVLEASMQLTGLTAQLLKEQNTPALFIPPVGTGWSKQRKPW
jgi:hypothetical protein